jgi:hypothetical protein
VAPVDLVTVHHEGSLANGGAPTDDVDRYSEGGYCCGIGATLFKRWRAPEDNYATLNYNGEDWTPCFSGDKHTGSHVSDTDIELLHAAYMDAYERGEVTADPLVRAHRNSPGSATACCGDYAIERWADIEAACRPGGPPPKPDEPHTPKDVDMQVIAVTQPGNKSNEQPFAFLDATARKVWSHWGLRIAWDGGDGDSTLHGDGAPHWIGIPGTAPLIGWEVLEVQDGGRRKRICAYGINGAEYVGTAHG